MAKRLSCLLLLAGICGSLGAAYRTQNFLVDAPTAQIAQQFGQAAEHYRKEKALEWLGQEMPPWPEPCPLQVKVTMGGAGGATSFAFDNGRVLGQHMNIEGSLDRLLASVLPHEVTHTVFAHYFRTPVPRWADEGGAVLSEDDIEKTRHDQLVRQILNTPGRAMPLRRLFGLKDYPGDVMTLYAQGFSMASFLVAASSKPAFLNFVADGMRQGWDHAVQAHYRYRSVEELEQAWLTHLRNTRRQPQQQLLASNTSANEATHQVMVRQTVPAAAPRLIVRGQSAGSEGGDYIQSPQAASGRPAYLPDYDPTQSAVAPPTPRGYPVAGNPDSWQPAQPGAHAPSPAVRLGPPQFAPTAPPTGASYGTPVGYPQ